MNPTIPQRWILLAAIIPATAVLPLTWTRIPYGYHGHREIAGYLQSLAYWRDPVGQLFYTTPAESLSSIHFHSILSAPLVGLGYAQGGRIISLAAAILASIVVGYITAVVVSTRAAPIAATALWAHPLFIKFAGGFMPETVSILLTSTSVLLLLLGTRQKNNILKCSAVILLIPAISTHLWEASIILPLFVLAMYQGQQIVSTMIAITGISTVLINLYLANLQPSSPSSLVRRYALWQDWSIIFQPKIFASPQPPTS